MTTLEVDKIKKYFPFHRICVVKTLVFLISCILHAQNCNLNKSKDSASAVLGKTVNVQSVYTRFIRFFKVKDKEVLIICILRLIQYLLSDLLSVQNEYVLSMDRTNWQLGTININILMIGIVLDNGRFIPIYFELLDKKGNSNQAERIELIELMKTIFKVDRPLVLAADREFIGKEWFDTLKVSEIDFDIRIRKKDYLSDLAQQMNISERTLTNRIRNAIEKQGYFVAKIKLKGKSYYYHVQRLKGKKDEISKKDKDIYIRFISTQSCPKWVIRTYQKRWKIEVFFEDIKEKSIRLEQINFTDLMKVRLMVAVASLCYALSLKQGLIEFKKRKIAVKLDKKSGNTYPRISIFTKGISAIRQIAYNIYKLNILINSFLDEIELEINNFPIIHLLSKKITLARSV